MCCGVRGCGYKQDLYYNCYFFYFQGCQHLDVCGIMDQGCIQSKTITPPSPPPPPRIPPGLHLDYIS